LFGGFHVGLTLAQRSRYVKRQMATPKEFARRLMTARVRAGYRSAKKFADAHNINAETYRRWERGDTMPLWHTLVEICAMMGITPNDLLLEDHEKPLDKPRNVA
jgi:DNA-binding XRE family transcriptional regulator